MADVSPPHVGAGPLAGLRVVDLSNGVMGAQASQLFADFGAEVILVEPPGGAPIRSRPAWPFWGRGKKSIELDLHDPLDNTLARHHALSSDVVIETFRPGVADRLGLGYQDLAAENARLIYASITGFGRSGPLADLQGYEGVVLAKLGALWTLSEMSDRPGPSFPSAPYCSFPAAQLAVQGVLAALYEREASGRGQRVETTLAQGLTVHDTYGWFARVVAGRFSGAYHQAPVSTKGIPSGGLSFRLLIALTADGHWMQFSQTVDRLFRAMMGVLGLDWMFDDPQWKTAPDFEDVDQRVAFWEHLLRAVRSKTVAEWNHVFDQHPDVWAEVFRHGTELLDHPQMQWNRMVAELDDPERGRVRQPGAIVRMDGAPALLARCAPRRGEYDAELRPGSRPAVADSPTGREPESDRPPLEGVTVVELGTYYAAPFGATLLAELGARVIKIEQLDGDPHRNMLSFPEVAGIKVLQGKQSVAVDVATQEGRAIAHELVRRADIVLQSFRAGVAERLGLDAATLRGINPEVIYLSAPGYGTGGPCGHRPAFAPTIGAAAGLAWCNAGATIPERADLELDEIKPAAMRLVAAVMGVGNADGFSAVAVGTALLLGLVARQRGAGAQNMLTTMLSTTAHALSADMVEYQGRDPTAAVDPGLYGLGARYRLYETADGWVFLAAPSERDWGRLVGALAGERDFATDERFATEEARRRYDGDLADELAAVFHKRAADEWERDLRASGVACVVAAQGPVEANMLDEGSVGRACGFVTETTHPMLDEIPRLTPLVAFSRSTTVARGACLVGQDTDMVLGELGYGAERLAALRDAGVIGT